jgi:pimeloyl-ACP methyl ester carboxylesterase
MAATVGSSAAPLPSHAEALMTDTSGSRALAFAVLLGVVSALAPAASQAQTHFEGAIGPGSTYEIDVPAGWNRSLVIYAHGLVQADAPILTPSLQPRYAELRAAMLANGYAVAASSYSSNGWALADAVRRTHQLSGLFTSKVEAPRRTYLMGASLGALVAVKLAEAHPGQYDGALAMCGPLGGALPELEYVGDARVIFDHYFPGVLPGTPFEVPPGTAFLSPLDPGGPSSLYLSVVAALAADTSATIRWASAANLPFDNMAELATSALYIIGFSLRNTNDFIDRVNGKMPYDNSDVKYVVDATADPALNTFLSAVLNAKVSRFDADRAAINYYDRNYTPSGQIGIPVLTLHTTRDPAIPFAHEAMFGAAVAAAGRSTLLAQQPIDRWGHCTFTDAEVLTAFGGLVQWVETGVKP